MSKLRLLLVIFSLMMTVSCSAVEEEGYHHQALQARSAYLALQQGTAMCSLTADYGERVYDYELVLTLSQVEGVYHSTLSLTAPEELAGISVTQEGMGAESRLVWEDLILETGDFSQEGLSPMTAIPLMLETLCSGYLESVSIRNEGVLELYSRNPDVPTGEGLELVLWLNSESYALLGGEIYQDGLRVISCEMKQFVMY